MWTRGESNPELIHAMDVCYRYTTGPFVAVRIPYPKHFYSLVLKVLEISVECLALLNIPP